MSIMGIIPKVFCEMQGLGHGVSTMARDAYHGLGGGATVINENTSREALQYNQHLQRLYPGAYRDVQVLHNSEQMTGTDYRDLAVGAGVIGVGVGAAGVLANRIYDNI